jgi:short-subunit dehydrogenase
MQMIIGKRVLITGAASGIGALTAQMLSEKGAIPILTARNETKLKEVTDSLKGKFGSYRMDVTNGDEVADTVRQAVETFGGIDVLINNAGYGLFEPFLDAPLDHFQAMMDTNYMGLVRCTKAVLPHLMKAGGGQIVNIASIAGKIGTPKSTGYTASKHAVLGFTNALRAELAGTGIVVSAVNPGPIDTPFFEKADPSGSYVNNVRWFMMPPERVARTIVRVIERKKTEVDLPYSAAAGIKIYQLFPRLVDKIAGKWLNQK